LKLYKLNGLYVFDKEEWNTVAEVFVPSATSYLEKLTDKDEPTLIFSDKPFPDSHKVTIVNDGEFESYGGTTYYSEEFDHYLWLCGYLNYFYPESPKEIYLQVI
jgi:hypothetical protein